MVELNIEEFTASMAAFNITSHEQKAVAIVLMKDDRVLGVTRKNNLDDWGLPGGKLEAGETFAEAAIRETKEETGLDIFNLKSIYWRMDDSFAVVAYIADWKGEITTSESGKVDWVTFTELKAGTFGEYNTLLEKILNER